MMANTSDVVSAIKELTTSKQLNRAELLDLLKDGLHAALVKRYGPNVRADIGIDELKGTIKIAILRTVPLQRPCQLPLRVSLRWPPEGRGRRTAWAGGQDTSRGWGTGRRGGGAHGRPGRCPG